MNKDERLKSYFNNIADVFFRGNWDKDEYEYLKQVIPEYLKIQLDIEEIPIEFKELHENTIGQYKPFKKEIEISQNSYSYKTNNMQQNVEQIFHLVVTISHELYHALDFRMKKGTRNFEDRCSALKHLSAHNPHNKEIYDAIQGAIYYNSRVETFARQGSLKIAQKFVEDLKSYAKANIKATENELREYQQLKEYSASKAKGQDMQCPQISDDGIVFSLANITMGIFENLWEGENYAEELNRNFHTANEMAYSHIVNKDLEELSEKIVSKEIEASEEMLFDISDSQCQKIFYNEKTITNLDQFARATEDEYIINTIEFNLQLAKQAHCPQKDNEQEKGNNTLF